MLDCDKKHVGKLIGKLNEFKKKKAGGHTENCDVLFCFFPNLHLCLVKGPHLAAALDSVAVFPITHTQAILVMIMDGQQREMVGLRARNASYLKAIIS